MCKRQAAAEKISHRCHPPVSSIILLVAVLSLGGAVLCAVCGKHALDDPRRAALANHQVSVNVNPIIKPQLICYQLPSGYEH
eukprot:scaffold185570_cov20-Tisochrysis_lutea.AAC.2